MLSDRSCTGSVRSSTPSRRPGCASAGRRRDGGGEHGAPAARLLLGERDVTDRLEVRDEQVDLRDAGRRGRQRGGQLDRRVLAGRTAAEVVACTRSAPPRRARRGTSCAPRGRPSRRRRTRRTPPARRSRASGRRRRRTRWPTWAADSGSAFSSRALRITVGPLRRSSVRTNSTRSPSTLPFDCAIAGASPSGPGVALASAVGLAPRRRRPRASPATVTVFVSPSAAAAGGERDQRPRDPDHRSPAHAASRTRPHRPRTLPMPSPPVQAQARSWVAGPSRRAATMRRPSCASCSINTRSRRTARRC